MTGKGIYQILNSRLHQNLYSLEQPLLRVVESLAMRQPLFSCRHRLPYRFKDSKEDAVGPSVKKGAPPDVSQLTANTLENIVVHSVVEGNATVSFGISPADPLYLLEPVEIIQGIYCELDFDLTYGEVIHDYIG